MRGSLYSVSDKAMFDAIKQSKVTKTELENLFLSRGILISPNTKRDVLASYFSLFPHSYYDYKRLSDILGHNNRKERSTYTRIEAEISNEVIDTAVRDLLTDLMHHGATGSVTRQSDNELTLRVEYREYNYGNSEFKQIVNKEATITIEKDESGETIIRHPNNGTVDEWKAILITKLSRDLEVELETNDISLYNISEPKKVTKFFEELINGIEGQKLHDVTDVYVFHADSEDDMDDIDFDSDDSLEAEITEMDDTELGTHILKASLKGQNVLNSEELKEFYKKNFYISKIVWRTKGVTIDDDIYEFEAQFSDAENREQFSYLVRGYYDYKGDSEYVKKRKTLSISEEKTLTKKLEISAQKAINSITGS